jgi:hypothetical protein
MSSWDMTLTALITVFLAMNITNGNGHRLLIGIPRLIRLGIKENTEIG